MKKHLLCVLLWIGIVAVSAAQEITRETGLHLGWGGGLSHKCSYSSGWMWEGVVGPRWGGVVTSFVLGRHFPIGETGFVASAGSGVQLGLYSRSNDIRESNAHQPVFLNPGLVLSGSTSYEIPETPFVVGVGYMPAFVFSADRVFVGENIQFILRYRWP